MTEPDSGISWLRVLLAFSVVSGLLGLLAYGLKYISEHQIRVPGLKVATRRLAVVESLAVDPRRRLVIVRRDGVEHLLLLGVNQDIVVEANLPVPPIHEMTKTKGPN